MPANTRNLLPLSTRISMYTAFVGGILTPVLETIRRWHQMSDLHYFMFWFDDYIIGGSLFFAAWKTYRYAVNGYRYLIAAWGFATGMAFSSFFSQLQRIDEPDPAPVSSATVALVKGIMLLICVLGLILALRHKVNSKVDKTLFI
jgi:hypothetical protein